MVAENRSRNWSPELARARGFSSPRCTTAPWTVLSLALRPFSLGLNLETLHPRNATSNRSDSDGEFFRWEQADHIGEFGPKGNVAQADSNEVKWVSDETACEDSLRKTKSHIRRADQPEANKKIASNCNNDDAPNSARIYLNPQICP